MTINTQRLRFLRGNSAAVAAFTGLQGELVFNTDTYTLHLQDGVSPGGYALATNAQVANISANANYGNSNVASYLASNSNIFLTTTGNIRTSANLLSDNYVAANILTIGGNLGVSQHDFLITSSNNTLLMTTANRGSGNVSIQIKANTSSSGINIRNDSGKIGFNTNAFGPDTGYTFTFNGNVSAEEYYATPNLPTGYQFNTVDGDTGISHVQLSPNLSALRIRQAGVETVKFYNNNTTEMLGNIVISDGVHYGQYPNAYLQIYGFANSYQQVINQNLSNNSTASSDFVATADNGTDSSYYIDMGINSSNFAQDYWFTESNTKNDGYLFVVGYNAAGPSTGNVGNLILGSTNGVVKTFVGNTTDANVVTTVSQGLLTVAGNVTASYFLGNGSQLTGITANANYGNTNVATYLSSLSNVKIGFSAGATNQGFSAVAVGPVAAATNQGNYAVAVGSNAGNYNQSSDAIAIGTGAGSAYQGLNAIAIGRAAGSSFQGNGAVAIGDGAGGSGGSDISTVAIGDGATVGGDYSVSIGRYARGGGASTIIINATGNVLNTYGSGFYVDPISSATTGNILYYDTSTKKITYGEATAGNYGNANVADYLPTYTGNVNAGNINSSYMYSAQRIFSNTAIFGYGTDGSGLIGAPIIMSGNSTTSLIGTNGLANNVASNLIIKTLNSNISLQLTGVNKTWSFDTAGNLTYPDGTKYSGNTVTLANSDSYYWSFNEPAGPVTDNVRLSFNSLTTEQGLWYFATDNTANTWILDSGTKTINFSNYPGTTLGGRLTFGNLANLGNAGVNDIELSSVNANAFVRASNSIWKFDVYGNLTAPGDITNGDGATIVFSTNNARINVGGGTTYVDIQDQDLFLISNAVVISSNGNSWDFAANGNLILPSNSSTIIYPNGVSILSGFTTPTAITNGNGSVSVASGDGNISFVVGGANFGHIQYGGGVAIGATAGNSNQGLSAVAIGSGAATENQGYHSVAIGWNVGQYNQGTSSIAIGENPGYAVQGNSAIAIGAVAARSSQSDYAIAMGTAAGFSGQGANAVAIGTRTAQSTQGANAVAIGTFAGNSSQGVSAIAIGVRAGNVSQGSQAVAIGVLAGQSSQGTDAVAIGSSAGAQNQLEGAVAIGQSAGVINQGLYAVAIGSGAGYQNQANNSIAITATGTQLSPEESGFYVDPVRNDTSNISEIVTYNTTTKELTYSNTVSISGNVTGNYFIGNGSLLTGIVASSSYGNTNVSNYLANGFGSNTVTTTGNISAAYFIGNGALLTGIVASGTNYTNANVVSMLAANTALYLGNVVTAYPTASNITTVFIGNNTTITAGGSGNNASYMMNNLYFQANGQLMARNTYASGAGQFSIDGGTFAWSATSSATANTAAGLGARMSLTSTLLSTQNSIGITSAGTLTVQGASGLVTTQTTGALFNTTATTINLGGAAATINMGAATAVVTVGSNTGNLAVGNITTNSNITVNNTVTTSALVLNSGGNVSGVGNIVGITANTLITAGNYVTSFLSNGSVTVTSNVIVTGNSAISVPNLPAFRVYGNSSTVFTSGTTITNQAIDYNQGSYYTNSTGLFTAPAAGLYHCYATVRVATNNGLNQASIQKNSSTSGANVIAFWETDTNTGTATHFSMTGYAKCVVGDTIRLQVISGNVNFDSNDSWGVTYIG